MNIKRKGISIVFETSRKYNVNVTRVLLIFFQNNSYLYWQ